MPTPTDTPPPTSVRHVVTTVIVAHEGQHWLPLVTAAVAEQTVPAGRIIAIDTSSTDASAGLLAQLVGSDKVIHAARTTGFGAAVALALATDLRRFAGADRRRSTDVDTAGGRASRRRHSRAGGGTRFLDPMSSHPPDPADGDVVEWLWLLHDDCEPAPDALAHLLSFVHDNPGVAVVGPKIKGWHDRRLLMEIGVSISRSGRRETWLERREQDQGQHDGVHERLAVSTAGMFVRRDVWAALGGLDPALPLFRDDVDFGWRANLAGYRVLCCTDAVVYHAEAAARGRRPIAATVDRRELADRRSAISVLLFNLPLSSLPWALGRLVVGSLFRVISLMFGKAPRSSLDELMALLSVLLRPDRIVRARFVRRRTRVRPARSALPLLADAAANLRHAMESVSAVLGVGPAAMAGAGAHRAVGSGPGGEGAENLPFWGTVLLRNLLSRPPIVLAVALVLATIVAARDLLVDGRLLGGALLPAPDSAVDLWRTYLESWHPVGLGSDASAAPYVAVVAALASVLFGSASLAVDVMLLAAVPVSGLVFYLAMRQLVNSVPLRLWAALTYAVSPALVGAIAAGRLGTAVLAMLLPVLAVLTLRALGGSGRGREGHGNGRGGSLRAAWGAALVLAVVTAFTPFVYVLALVVASLVVLFWTRGRARLRVLVIVLTPLLLLAPWLPTVVADPHLLLREAGLAGPALADPDVPGWSLVLLNPGGPGTYPVFFTVGVVLAAVAALLRADRRDVLSVSWIIACLGLVGAVVVSRANVSAPMSDTAVAGWPGPPLLVATAALLVAAVVGANGARARVSRSSFGWRQLLSVVVAALAAAAPVLGSAWWTANGAGEPLVRRDGVLLPAFVSAEGERGERPRTLVLRPADGGVLGYALLRADGPRLGDAEIASSGTGNQRLDEVVADLTSGAGAEAAVDLVPYGVRFVLLSGTTGGGTTRTLVRAIDAVPGLVRVSASKRSALWKIDEDLPTGRVRIVDPRRPPGDVSDLVLPSDAVGVRATISGSLDERWIVLAERRHAGWRASYDGAPLRPRTYDGWAQAFVLPDGSGLLEIHHEHGLRGALLWVQLATLVLALILILPAARRADDSDEVFGPLDGAADPRHSRQPAQVPT